MFSMHLLCAHITTIRQRQRGSFSANFSTWRMESAYGSLGRRYSKSSPNSCKSMLENNMLAQLGNHYNPGRKRETERKGERDTHSMLLSHSSFSISQTRASRTPSCSPARPSRRRGPRTTWCSSTTRTPGSSTSSWQWRMTATATLQGSSPPQVSSG